MAYADLFGAGLTEAELRQRLFGAWPAHIADLRERLGKMGNVLETVNGRWRLKGSPTPRPGVAVVTIPMVRAWAARAGRLPFIRYLGLTGALAKGAPDSDVDLLVVAAPGRAYLAFAMLKTLGASLARDAGLKLCVNYVVDEAHLTLAPHDVFTATEFVTQVPLYDEEMLGLLWAENQSWIGRACATAACPAAPADSGPTSWPKRALELCTFGWGGLAEAWVRSSKRGRLAAQLGAGFREPDVIVAPGVFKQHDASHHAAILAKYRARLDSLGLDHAWLELG